MKRIFSLIVCMLFLFSMTAFALDLDNIQRPTIMPDRPFAFMNGVFNLFKSNERVMEEKFGAIIILSQGNNTKVINRAKIDYEKFVERRLERANEKELEYIFENSEKHIEVLNEVRELVPEEAKIHINNAITNAKYRSDRSVDAISDINIERGNELRDMFKR